MKKWGGEEGEKGGGEEEPPPKKQQDLGEKLQRLTGKRGGQITPVLSFPLQFRTGGAQDSIGGAQERDLVVEKEEKTNPGLGLAVSLPPSTSARKLAATAWELHQYDLPFAKMHNGDGGGGGGGSRRNHRYQQLHHLHHHNHRRHHLLEDNPDPSPASPDLGSASSLRRHVAASLLQHHRTTQRNHTTTAIRAVSPASYGSSSMEVAPYNPAVTPTSSIEFKAGNGETSYNLKTSTELLKVLNRIWSLEEQHTANVTLIRALKRELDLSRAKIKELARDRQSDRHEMQLLVNQISQQKQGESVRDELEDERKLRKRSETLHRKLAREVYETKTSLVTALRDLENERRSRVLLEDLCDEFAWGIKNYEQELHNLKVITPDKRPIRDGLILHISESWLDERMQTNQELKTRNNSVVEKLSSEIEAFLEAKRKGGSGSGLGSGSVVGPAARRRHSLESIPINLAASAPPDDGDDGSSDGGDSNSPCFELDKPIARDKDEIVNSTAKPDHGKKKLAPQATRDSSNLQVKFEEQMAQAILGHEKAKTGEITEEKVGLNSKYLDSLLKNHYLQSGNEFDESGNKPVWESQPSPVRGWSTRLPIQDLEISESSSKVPPESNLKSRHDSNLKSKLLEARTRGHRLGSRVKSNKVSF